MDCSSWWFDHVGETYIYVIATRAGDAGTQEKEVENLVDGAKEWGNLIDVPEASALMADHVVGAKTLADTAFAHDQAGVDAAVEGLLANLEDQAALYEEKIPNFPAEEWHRLFSTHLTTTGGYILALAAGDIPDFKAKYAQVLLNRNALSRFWARVCMQRKR